ncbi:MAG TPA: hypothetical protein VG713_09815 [Pirellulales bacterium]|nr:hypothetical protein [Pirellulales bacterium]
MPDVTIKLSLDDAEAVRKWQKFKQEGPGAVADEVDRIGKSAGRAQSSMSSMLGNVVSQVTGVRMAFTGVGIAIAGITAGAAILKREWEEMIARRKSAGDFQTQLAPAQRSLLRNFGRNEDLSIQQLDSGIRQIARSTGSDLAAVYSATGGALSARAPGTPASEVLRRVAAGARLDPSLSAGELQSLSGASLDFQKAFGGTPEQALGAILDSQRTARVETTQQFAQNVVPALIGLKNFGGGYRQSSALISAITQESADVEGARSGTAAIQLAKQIEQATARVDSLKGKGTTERIDYLLSGDKRAESIRRSLVGSFDQSINAATDQGLTSEAKQYTAVRGLLIKGSSVRRMYDEALASTADIGDAQAVYESNLRAQEQIGSLRTARLSETFRGAQQALLLNEKMGSEGVARQGLEDYLKQSGATTAVGRWAQLKAFDLKTKFGGYSATEAAQAQLEGVRRFNWDKESVANIDSLSSSLRGGAPRSNAGVLQELVDSSKRQADATEALLGLAGGGLNVRFTDNPLVRATRRATYNTPQAASLSTAGGTAR